MTKEPNTPQNPKETPKVSNKPSPENPIEADSKFDPVKLRLSQDFTAQAGVKKHFTTVPVKKPANQAFVQVHPGEDYRLECMVVELKEDREIYLVAPDICPELVGEVTRKILFTAITLQKVLFIWPVRLPDIDGKLDTWNASALEAAKLAEGKWVRITANRSLGAYDVFEATGSHKEPEWPDLSFQQILAIAFKDRFIESLDHPVLKKLRGEI